MDNKELIGAVKIRANAVQAKVLAMFFLSKDMRP
jgi:hypothetical protein